MTSTDTPTPTTHRDKLRAAFKELRRIGYLARMNFTCCGSCGGYELAEVLKQKPAKNGYVFWHRQADDAFGPDDDLDRTLYLAWGTCDNRAFEIVGVLVKHGLKASWNGEPFRCVEVEADA